MMLSRGIYWTVENSSMNGEFPTMDQYGKHYFLFITSHNAQHINICLFLHLAPFQLL